MGHRPSHPCSQGSKVDLYTERPYASTAIVTVTFPERVDVPTTSKASERLPGVKTTLKSVAENLEFSRHEFSDED